MPVNLASVVDSTPHFADDGQHECHCLYLSPPPPQVIIAITVKKLQISMLHSLSSEGNMHRFPDRKLRKFPNASGVVVLLPFKFTGGKKTRFDGPLLIYIRRETAGQWILVYMKVTKGDWLKGQHIMQFFTDQSPSASPLVNIIS